MLRGKLSEHLKYLLSRTRKSTDGGRYGDQSYHSSVENRPPLNELVSETLAIDTASKGRGHRLSPNQLFSLQLLKKIVLTQFELLCVSAELQNDVEYAFSECCSFCEHSSLFNTKMTSVSHQSKHFEFAEFADIAISTQTQLILNSFLHESSVNTVISLAKFEQGFLSALTAIFGTFTSLLLPPRASKKLKAVFVSEEMFSMAKSSSLSWLDCLIPGAQSEVLRLTVKDLINQLWSKVTSHLVAHLQPLTVGGEDVEAVLSLLRNALQHQG